MDDDELYEHARSIWAAVEYGDRDRAIRAMRHFLTLEAGRRAAERWRDALDELADH